MKLKTIQSIMLCLIGLSYLAIWNIPIGWNRVFGITFENLSVSLIIYIIMPVSFIIFSLFYLIVTKSIEIGPLSIKIYSFLSLFGLVTSFLFFAKGDALLFVLKWNHIIINTLFVFCILLHFSIFKDLKEEKFNLRLQMKKIDAVLKKMKKLPNSIENKWAINLFVFAFLNTFEFSTLTFCSLFSIFLVLTITLYKKIIQFYLQNLMMSNVLVLKMWLNVFFSVFLGITLKIMHASPISILLAYYSINYSKYFYQGKYYNKTAREVGIISSKK